MTYCTECGAEIDDSVNYCPECGASTEGPPGGAEPATTAATESSESTDSTSSITVTKVIAWIGGILLLFWALPFLFVAPLGGIIALLAALFCFPPVRRKLTDVTDVEFSSGIVAVIVIVAFFASIGAMVATVDTSDTGESGDTDSLDTNSNPNTESQSGPSTESTSQPSNGEPADSSTDSTEQYRHEVGDSFVVGSGDNQIRYSVQDVYTLDTVGSQYYFEEADGVYVVVELSMENTGSKSYDITTNHLNLVDTESREFSADTGASIYASQDSRVGAETITFDQLQPGLTVERSVIFDVPPGESYALKIEPTGLFSADEPHLVALGRT